MSRAPRDSMVEHPDQHGAHVLAWRAEKERRRLARIAEMRANCQADCGVPCSLACERGCHKRRLHRRTVKARKARIVAANRRLAGPIVEVTRPELSPEDRKRARLIDQQMRLVDQARAARRRDDTRRAWEEEASRHGGRLPEMATPERLAKAGAFALIEHAEEVVVKPKDEGFEEDYAPAPRQRMKDSQFEQAIAMCWLDKDPETNAILKATGFRFRMEWEMAAIASLRAIDISQPTTGKTGAFIPISTEEQLKFRQKVRAALAVLDRDEQNVVEAVVVSNQTLAASGLLIREYSDRRQASAVAVYVLRSALLRLDHHYAAVDKADGDARHAAA